VDEEPGEPGQQTREFERTAHGYGAAAPNSGHGALVEILERSGVFSVELIQNIGGRVFAVLHGYRGYSGQRFAVEGVGMGVAGHISQDVDIAHPLDAQIGLHRYSPGAVQFGAQ